MSFLTLQLEALSADPESSLFSFHEMLKFAASFWDTEVRISSNNISFFFFFLFLVNNDKVYFTAVWGPQSFPET